jgi:hypothetical protein
MYLKYKMIFYVQDGQHSYVEWAAQLCSTGYVSDGVSKWKFYIFIFDNISIYR